MDYQQTSKVQTVVQGEASESDDDNEGNVQFANIISPFPSRVLPPNPQTLSPLCIPKAKAPPAGIQAIVVAGEASESDEEEVDTSQSEKDSPKLPPLEVDQNKRFEHGASSDLSIDVPMLLSPRMAESRFNKPKYDTLLHRKLRESNLQLYEHIVDAASQTYLAAARSLNSTTVQFAKSLNLIQDISNSMRLLTNDLFHLDDRVDIVRSCKLLPGISLPATAASLTTQTPLTSPAS